MLVKLTPNFKNKIEDKNLISRKVKNYESFVLTSAVQIKCDTDLSYRSMSQFFSE
jgi:hypothetical protein